MDVKITMCLVAVVLSLTFCITASTGYANELSDLEARANQGNADAQVKLAALLVSRGHGSGEDMVKAAHWYEKAAEQGHTNAQFEIARLYHVGSGVAQNLATAASWYEKAAEQGHDDARFNLANMYFNGEGVPRDKGKACEHLKIAFDNGHATAARYFHEACPGFAGENKSTVGVSKTGITIVFPPTDEQLAAIAAKAAEIDPKDFRVNLTDVDDATLTKIVEAYPNIVNLTVEYKDHGSKGHLGVTTLAPLAKLTKLRVLNLWNFPNGKDLDLNILEALPELTQISLQNNTDLDISPIGKTSIRALTIGRQITEVNLEFLSTMPKLAMLTIRNSEGVSNFAALGNLVALTSLTLESVNTKKGDPVDVSFVSKLQDLRDLHLSRTPVTHFENLAGAAKLIQLSLVRTTGVTTLAPLKGLKLMSLIVSKGAFTEKDLADLAEKGVRIVQQ